MAAARPGGGELLALGGQLAGVDLVEVAAVAANSVLAAVTSSSRPGARHAVTSSMVEPCAA